MVYGHIWSSLVMFGQVYLCMVMHVCICSCMVREGVQKKLIVGGRGHFKLRKQLNKLEFHGLTDGWIDGLLD